jgi:RHS repeat-associated protein
VPPLWPGSDTQNGRLTGTTQGSLSTTHTYDDSVGTLKRSTATYSSTTLLDFQYTRDTLDRITQVIETVQGTAQTWNYAYDSVGRLDQVRLNTVLVADYAYDGNGNRTGLTTQSGSVTGTVDDQDRLLTYGTNSYTYSSNGELKMKVNGVDTTRYTYDVLENLLQVQLPTATTIDYLVDGQNRRIGRKVNGVLTQGFLYQGQLAPIAELDGSNNVVSRFVYGTRVNVPEYMVKAGVTYRLLTDHLGSVRLVVNTATGAVAQRIDYDEYGRITQNTNPGFQPFGFAGGLYDDATKLGRFGARDYDAETGRWTAKDPLLFQARQANLYSYGQGDPANFVDPAGLCPCEPTSGSEYTASVGAGVLAGGAGVVAPFVGAGGSVGITSSGRVVIQMQMTFSAGPGAFAGAGVAVGVGRNDTGLRTGFSGSNPLIAQGNIGVGPSFGGSFLRGTGEIGLAASPTLRGGFGFGAQTSVGRAPTLTFATPSIFQILCRLGQLMHWLADPP